MSVDYEVRLRLHSGVPIVDVLGEWKPTATDALAEMIDALSRAGHYDIVVNLQRAALEGVSALQSLAQMARKVRSHHGHLAIVGTAAQRQRLAEREPEGLFRLAASEETAIGRIKRIPVLTAGLNCTARPRRQSS